MTESLSSLDGFLTEFKATLSQPSGAAVLRRINAERLLSLIAEEFVASHEAERIRILPDNRVAGPSGSDFLLQIDDYDIRIEFLDAPDGQLSIEPTRQGGLFCSCTTILTPLLWFWFGLRMNCSLLRSMRMISPLWPTMPTILRAS